MTVDFEQHISLQVGISESLPGVGFHSWMEIDVLRRDLLETTREEKNPQDTLESWLAKAKKNLVGYWLEYLDQRLVLPINLEIAEDGNAKRVISKGNKNAVWVDSIGSWERNGSVKESAVKIEEFLLNAPTGSAAVLVSPGGHEYPDTQTYIFWINPEGTIDSMTIRTDPDIEDNESFLFNTSPNFNPDTNIPLGARVEAIVRNPLFLTAQNGFAFSPESIIEAIRKTKRGQDAFKAKGFEKLFSDLADKDKLLEAGGLIETVIGQFVDFSRGVFADSNSSLDKRLELIEEKLGETVLKMSYIKRHLQNQNLDAQTAINTLGRLNRSDYQNELAYLQTIPGCAGGGNSKSYTENGFGFRETQSSGTCQICGSTKEVVCGFCKECGKRMKHQ